MRKLKSTIKDFNLDAGIKIIDEGAEAFKELGRAMNNAQDPLREFITEWEKTIKGFSE